MQISGSHLCTVVLTSCLVTRSVFRNPQSDLVTPSLMIGLISATSSLGCSDPDIRRTGNAIVALEARSCSLTLTECSCLLG